MSRKSTPTLQETEARSGYRSFDELALSTVNSLWGAFAAEALARLGVREWVISPGSRSTPLAFAAARNAKVRATPVLDERSAGFFALGLARRAGRPAVLVCTSGTAAANYYPAVIEASMNGTPMLVFTADRPPESRHCGAGQTIDQTRLFGVYPRHFAELALPEATTGALRYLRQTLVHGLDRALHPAPGPVHLNWPFREPLAPLAAGEPVVSPETPRDQLARLREGAPPGRASGDGGFDEETLELMRCHPRGLIVVGPVHPAEDGAAFAEGVRALGAKLGWPILADAANPLRSRLAGDRRLVAHYERILRDAEAAGSLAPSAVLQIGPLPASKTLRAWLEALDAPFFLLHPFPRNIDPLHADARPMAGRPDAVARALPDREARADDAWIDAWREAADGAASAIDAAMEALPGFFEGKIAWTLSRTLPAGCSVLLASSMSVRYAEYFWRPSEAGHALHANRGANGIDGSLGTALGLAHGGAPTVLLIGDLAWLHDSNALLAARELDGSLTVVVAHNGGGGIFENLAVASHEPPFERFFATPQEADIGRLCEGMGIAHQRISDAAELAGAVREPAPDGVRVLECRTDRKADRATLARLLRPESRAQDFNEKRP